MKPRPAFAIIAGVLAISCGWTQRTNVRHTLLGVSRDQALVAAHRALAEQSYEVESVDLEAGRVTTAWRDRPSRSLRYVITVDATVAQPAGGARPCGGHELCGTGGAEVTVTAEARDRAVRGWTEGYPVPNEASRMLRHVEREARGVTSVALAAPPPPPPPPPPAPEPPPAPPERSCTASRDCPPGQHCGTGRCVWECATDDECEAGAQCDRRGRCVAPPAAAPAPAEGEE
jgi:hypothetical protein